MGTYRVIGDVDEMLIELLKNGFKNGEFVTDIEDIKLGSPDDITDQKSQAPQIVLFLYKIDENPHYKNQFENTKFSEVKSCFTALDISYIAVLIDSNNRSLEHMMAGKVIELLGKNGILKGYKYKKAFDFQNSDEAPRLIMQTLSVDELSKIWSAFPKISGKTLVSFMVTPVLIETEYVDEKEKRVLEVDVNYTEQERSDF